MTFPDQPSLKMLRNRRPSTVPVSLPNDGANPRDCQNTKTEKGCPLFDPPEAPTCGLVDSRDALRPDSFHPAPVRYHTQRLSQGASMARTASTRPLTRPSILAPSLLTKNHFLDDFFRPLG